MKKINSSIFLLAIIMMMFSCKGKKSHFEEFSKDKKITSRILDLNKTIGQIRIIEKGKLVKEDINLLKYNYEIGEKDSYVVSYLFDEKGCYEIGIDGSFEFRTEAQTFINEIKSSIKTTEYGLPNEDNSLSRWKNSSGSISIELDYKDIAKGIFLITIFANE